MICWPRLSPALNRIGLGRIKLQLAQLSLQKGLLIDAQHHMADAKFFMNEALPNHSVILEVTEQAAPLLFKLRDVRPNAG